MPITLLLDIAGHAGIEGIGGLGWGCLLLLCRHDHFHGRLTPLNRLVHSRAWRAAVLGILALATSAATVCLLDSGKLADGAGVFALGIALHMSFEGLGGGVRAALAHSCQRAGVTSRFARWALLGGAYLLLAAVCVATVDRWLGG